MAFINTITIHKFRAIQDLTVSDFSCINLIVGDNNSGKTTFLEAIQLLFAKAQLSSIKSTINQRTLLKNSERNSFYASFIRLFNTSQSTDRMKFDIYAQSNKGPLGISVTGRERVISGDDALQLSKMSARQKNIYISNSEAVPESVKCFEGKIITQEKEKTSEIKFSYTSLDTEVSGQIVNKEVQYIPSFGHLRFDLLQNIVDNPEYKKLAINILKQFDDSIADICYTKADDGSFMETVITNNGIIMPFSVYGDGIKKILYILNKLFDATDSILMIDEIETGLHKKYYEPLFPVIFALAKKLNVQLFIATHSIEAIDSILRYGKYDDVSSEKDPIKVITLKKVCTDNNYNVVARNVTGKYVYENRKAFEFEVRL